MTHRSLIRRCLGRGVVASSLALSATLAAGTLAFAGGPDSGAATKQGAALASQITRFSETFTYTGSVQQATVPLGVTSVRITADGASGGGTQPDSTIGGTPGLGASVTTVVATPTLTTFSLYVGQQGGSSTDVSAGGGGSSSGAPAAGGSGALADQLSLSQNGGGGGGATVVDVGDTPLLVAGGGGGAGGASINDTIAIARGGSGGGAGILPGTGTYGQGAYGGPGGPGGGAATGTGQSAFNAVPGSFGGGGGGGGGGYPNGGNAGAPGYGNLGGGGGGGGGDSYAAPGQTALYGSAPAGNGSVTISWALPVVRLVTSATSISYHAKIKLTADVEGAGTPLPTGSVNFYDMANKMTTLLGTVTLKVDGKLSQATLTTAALPPGTNRLSFTYSGDANYPAAHSVSTPVTVNDPKASATPTDVNFGDTAVGFTAWRQVIVKSTGLTPMAVQSIMWTGGGVGGFSLQETNCVGVTLAPGESCTVLFGFDPETTGPATGTADITTTASKPLVVTLSGTGV